MKKILIFCALLMIFLTGCGKQVEMSPKAEKREILPKKSMRLVADVTNPHNSTYLRKYSYYWTIRTPDCGEISCVACSSVWWTAPALAPPKPRLCTISAEVTLIDNKNVYQDRFFLYLDNYGRQRRRHLLRRYMVTTYFDIKVDPYSVKNRAPAIARFNVPLQFVSLDETVSLSVEVEDPKSGPLKYDSVEVEDPKSGPLKYDSVEVEDPKSGPLKYYWTATCGEIEGISTSISWWTTPLKVPAGDNCTIHVSVEDQEKSTTGASAEFVVK